MPDDAGTVLVRLARAAEYAAVGELTVDSYRRDGQLGSSGYAEQLRDAARRAGRAQLLVAVDASDDRLLGTVTFAPHGSEYADLAGPGQAEFRMLAVAPDARRRGAGAALVRACIERATAAGVAALVICTAPGMTAARALYAKLGFRRDPDLDWAPVPAVRLIGYRYDIVARDRDIVAGDGDIVAGDGGLVAGDYVAGEPAAGRSASIPAHTRDR